MWEERRARNHPARGDAYWERVQQVEHDVAAIKGGRRDDFVIRILWLLREMAVWQLEESAAILSELGEIRHQNNRIANQNMAILRGVATLLGGQLPEPAATELRLTLGAPEPSPA